MCSWLCLYLGLKLSNPSIWAWFQLQNHSVLLSSHSLLRWMETLGWFFSLFSFFFFLLASVVVVGVVVMLCVSLLARSQDPWIRRYQIPKIAFSEPFCIPFAFSSHSTPLHSALESSSLLSLSLSLYDFSFFSPINNIIAA